MRAHKHKACRDDNNTGDMYNNDALPRDAAAGYMADGALPSPEVDD